MKKILKNLFLVSIFLLLGMTKVKANNINSIDMDVYIDNKGNASITEVWNATLTQGTEGYRPYTRLGDSSITDFSVVDQTGTLYQKLDYWNTSASFNDKAYRSGINHITNGIELCWGISNYGNNTYTLKYDISNFVKQYTDTQGIYFNFLNLDQEVDQAKITIHSDIPFSLDNARIWAFGNNGTINFVDGNIVLDSGSNLLSAQYMVALVRFEENIFDVELKNNQSFDDIYDEAFEDIKETNNNYGQAGVVEYFVLIVTLILFNPLSIGILIVFVCIKNSNKNYYSTYVNFGKFGKVLPNEINYYRKIPCNKDLERAYWVAYQYNVVSTSTLKEGIIGAILLKWIKEGYITVRETKKGLFSFKDNNYAIDLSNVNSVPNEIENNLLEILKTAAGLNNILEAKELKKWCKKHYGKMQTWFSDFNKLEQAELEKQGLIYDSEEETKNIFGKPKITYVKTVSDTLREDAVNLAGLKKFLLDFSMMPEREYFQVHIWEEYLIFAQLLGIADKVEEQFSKLYPKFSEESHLDLNITTVAIRGMAYLSYSGMQEGYERYIARQRSYSSHDYSGSSRDSGGGGSSYSSGGSSSGGSSGGGFR